MIRSWADLDQKGKSQTWYTASKTAVLPSPFFTHSNKYESGIKDLIKILAATGEHETKQDFILDHKVEDNKRQYLMNTS